MNKDIRNERNDERKENEEEQLRPNTTNEMIREVNGNADTDINTLREGDAGNEHRGSGGAHNSDLTRGSSYTPNDASGVRSGGTADMDDQTAGGAGQIGRGTGSGLAPKTGITGSDFDGQNATS